MMTKKEKLEKAINGLEYCLDVQSGWEDARYVCPSCPYTDNGIPCESLAPLMEDALALLKAQEPVKPETIMYTGAGIGISNCPRCGNKIDEYHNDRFCGSCGQAVKWE